MFLWIHTHTVLSETLKSVTALPFVLFHTQMGNTSQLLWLFHCLEWFLWLEEKNSKSPYNMSPLKYARIDSGLLFLKQLNVWVDGRRHGKYFTSQRVFQKLCPLPDNRYFAIAERFDSRAIIFHTAVKMTACLYVGILHLHLLVLSLWHILLSWTKHYKHIPLCFSKLGDSSGFDALPVSAWPYFFTA